MACFVASLDVEPQLSLATATALKDCMLGLARLCTQETRIVLAKSNFASLLRGAGLPGHVVHQVMAAVKPLPVVEAIVVPDADPVPHQQQRRRWPPSLSSLPLAGAASEAKKRKIVDALVSEETRSELGLAKRKAFPSTFFTGHNSAPMLTPQQIRERNEFAAAKPTGGGGAPRPRVRVQPAPRKSVQPLLPASPGLGESGP
jgi:hypothetical protein